LLESFSTVAFSVVAAAPVVAVVNLLVIVTETGCGPKIEPVPQPTVSRMLAHAATNRK